VLGGKRRARTHGAYHVSLEGRKSFVMSEAEIGTSER